MPIRYAPVGKCIYCGATAKPLTTEHIIPESLNGQNELPKASCTDCAKIINGYELTVGRTIFGDFRIKYGLRSKRSRKLRPETIDIEFAQTLDANSPITTKTIPRKEFPSPIMFYKFQKATLLRGLPFGTGIFEWVPIIISDQTKMKAFHDKHGHSRHKFRTSPYELARMLAKIGHGFAVAELGIDGFSPLKENLDVILNKTDDVGYTVGGSMDIAPPILDRDHFVRKSFARVLGQRLILVIYEIRLFCGADFPTFHVVVGTMNPDNDSHSRKLFEEPSGSTHEQPPFSFTGKRPEQV